LTAARSCWRSAPAASVSTARMIRLEIVQEIGARRLGIDHQDDAVRVLDLLRGVGDVAVFRRLDIAQLLGWRTIRHEHDPSMAALQRNESRRARLSIGCDFLDYFWFFFDGLATLFVRERLWPAHLRIPISYGGVRWLLDGRHLRLALQPACSLGARPPRPRPLTWDSRRRATLWNAPLAADSARGRAWQKPRGCVRKATPWSALQRLPSCRIGEGGRAQFSSPANLRRSVLPLPVLEGAKDKRPAGRHRPSCKASSKILWGAGGRVGGRERKTDAPGTVFGSHQKITPVSL
jgi:hypothetical protein